MIRIKQEYMKYLDISFMIILPVIQWTLASGTCPIGEPLALAENGTLFECSKLAQHSHCPEHFTCLGGVLKSGICCMDPLALLCKDCTTFQDVHYSMNDSGGTFHVNVLFRWGRRECSESALLYRWDPLVRVLVQDRDNHTVIERTLNCKFTEKPCSRHFSMKIKLQQYKVLYQVKGPGLASYCRYIEIATVSRPSSPPTPLPSLPESLSSDTEPSPPVPSSGPVIAIVIGITCFVAMTTAVVFVCRLRSRRHPQNSATEFTRIEGNRDIFVVAMPEIGSLVLSQLKQATGLLYVTIDQRQTEIFRNSSEWIDSIEQSYTNFLFLLTESLVDNGQDDSHPLNEVTKSLFNKLCSSSQLKYKNAYFIYLTKPSAIPINASACTKKNRYDLSGGKVSKRDFSRLVSDLSKT